MQPIQLRLYVALICAALACCAPAQPVVPDLPKPAGSPVPPGTGLPAWPKPAPANLPASAPSVRSGDLELLHASDLVGNFVVRVAGKPFAVGPGTCLVAYLNNGTVRWFNFNEAADKKLSVQSSGKGFKLNFTGVDPDGARWTLLQQFSPGRVRGSVEIETEFQVDQQRTVAFLPMLSLFPGAGTFGDRKGQGLLAGLEYLENEPSSSEADLTGPAAKRQVPDTLKLTFPLMAIQNEGCYLALTWQMRPQFSALFDSPDRLFGSGGHVMGILFPGSNGQNRQEGQLLPRLAEKVAAGGTIVLRATLLGGRGETVVEAVQQYLAFRPAPPLPGAGTDLAQYAAQAAGAWLDSGIRENNLLHHAILGGSFPLQPAADAALWTRWLAEKSAGPEQKPRLLGTSSNLLAAVPPASFYNSGVGHVRYPAAPLLFGHVEENVRQTREFAAATLRAFEPDGSLRYRPRPGGPDFAKTHYTNEANGLTSRSVLDLLEAASFCGDRSLLEASVARLRSMNKFHNGVPRGAQTWECPLHTPDILASAQMVRAYALGFELTGDPTLLKEAKYWAWTGLPFVYLVNPTDNPVGPYATIAVFGATQWAAPVWLGLPVQWCGLVYADALYRLARYDPDAPWTKIADGITLSGIQQCWPSTNKANQGLLPDSIVLRTQHRNGPAINPATVQACAAQLFRQTPVYDFHCFRQNNVLVHAPGAINKPEEKRGSVSFGIEPALPGPYFVLIHGSGATPELKIDGRKTECSAPHQLIPNEGRLILRLEGKARVELAPGGKS